MKKNNKALKIIALSTGASIALGVCGLINSTKIDNRKKELLENGVAVTASNDVLSSIWSKKKDKLAVINVGNSKVTNTNFQQYKLDYLDDKDINTAVIVDCNTSNIANIYKDIDYVKSVLKENDINLPVYMNINHIMENVNLNNNQKKELIVAFLEKCSSNGMYVGVSGTDTNLCRLKDYVYSGIIDYDTLVEMEEDTIKYNGTYNMYKTTDGYYVLKSNLSNIIKEKNFNDSEKFQDDAKYTYSTKEDFEKQLFQCGLSKTELKKYNNILFLNKGDVLTIPNVISTRNQDTTISGYNTLEEPIIGCDISSCQVEGNWDKLSKNMEFIIIKAATGSEEDSKFAKHYKKCMDYNIPVGIYTIIDCTKIGYPKIEDYKVAQSKSSTKTLELLQNKKVDLPVYIDIENPYAQGSVNYGKPVRDLLPKEYVQYMLDDWYTKMSNAGYIPGIYANKETMNYLSECVDYKLSDKFEIWIAGGTLYDHKANYANYSIDSDLYNYKDASIHQVTQKAIGAGIGNDDGYLDINLATVDYSDPNYIDDSSYKKEEKEQKKYRFSPDGAIALAALGAAAGAGIASKKVRRKK